MFQVSRFNNPWFPSSKRYSCCGYVNNGLKLSDRIWKCHSCLKILDRDINVAKIFNRRASGVRLWREWKTR